MTIIARRSIKLTPAQIGEIAAEYAAGTATQKHLAVRYSVSIPVIGRALAAMGTVKGADARDIAEASQKAHALALIIAASTGTPP
jgi:hypothetical protein